MIRSRLNRPPMSFAGSRTRRPACGPAMLGSLSFRRSRCDTRTARPVCPASSIRATFCTAGTTDGGSRCMFPKTCRRGATALSTMGVPCRTCWWQAGALRQGVEARAASAVSATRVSRGASGGAADQLCGWRTDRQGVRLEPLLEAISKFLDRSIEDRGGAARSRARLKKPLQAAAA